MWALQNPWARMYAVNDKKAQGKNDAVALHLQFCGGFVIQQEGDTEEKL